MVWAALFTRSATSFVVTEGRADAADAARTISKRNSLMTFSPIEFPKDGDSIANRLGTFNGKPLFILAKQCYDALP